MQCTIAVRLVIARLAHESAHGRGIALDQRADVVESFAKALGRLGLEVRLDVGRHGQREVVVREKRDD